MATLASFTIDRREQYYTKPEHRLRDDYNSQFLRGLRIQAALRWHKPAPKTDPDAYMGKAS